MHRFYLPAAASSGSSLTLTDREAHHALQVLRVRQGERVTVLDGNGHQLFCEVLEADRRTLTLKVIEKKFIPPLPYELTLAQSLLKGKAMDWVVQKATELGAHRLVPILAEHSVPRMENENAAARVEKWNVIAIESIKQCGSAWLPRFDAPATVEAFLTHAGEFDLSLVGSLQNDAHHPRQSFENFRAKHGHPPRSVCIWIGPEGDFTQAELDSIKSAGAQPISFGSLALRSDTAAVSALAILNYELQGK